MVGISNGTIALSPFSTSDGLAQGARVSLVSRGLKLSLTPALKGRVVDGFLSPIDGIGDLVGPFDIRDARGETASPMARPLISQPFTTGVRAIDGLITLGVGQRMGVFGSPGTGKTSLLGMLVRQCKADIIVVGLVGERGREVREFIDEVLPENMRENVVVVAATSERPAMERAICAHSATTVAEYFRDQGKSVFLLIDSLTRTARGLREIGLAAGEAPTRRGFPASVYPALPAIIERAGRSAEGDITAVYTVLTEGDIESDPIAEEVKSVTDGHIVLSRDLAKREHYPAIDVLSSLSRSMSRVALKDHTLAAAQVRRLIAKYNDIEMLLQVGEYESGSDHDADQAISAQPNIQAFLRQQPDDGSAFEATKERLKALLP